jgi:hypothetical protein
MAGKQTIKRRISMKPHKKKAELLLGKDIFCVSIIQINIENGAKSSLLCIL